MSSTACDDQFAPETEQRPTVAVCARTHTSDQVLTGNYLQIDAEKLEKDCRLARERGKTVCVWEIHSDHGVNTSCQRYFGDITCPLLLEYSFCPFCRKQIKVKT